MGTVQEGNSLVKRVFILMAMINDCMNEVCMSYELDLSACRRFFSS